MKRHVQKEHEGIKFDMFPCTVDGCERIYARKNNMKSHTQSMHEGIKFNCEKCEFKGNYKRTLEAHIQRAHAGATYTCVQMFPCTVDGCERIYTKNIARIAKLP